MAGALSEKAFLSALIDAGFSGVEVLGREPNKRTPNRDAYVVILQARKARKSQDLFLHEQDLPQLRYDNAATALKDLWIFPVPPEVCNLQCTHCLYAASPFMKNSYHLTMEEVEAITAELQTLGARPHWLVTGGEPTLHPQLYDFFHHFEERGYSFQLMTNATRLNDAAVEQLAHYRHLKKIQISFEGSTS
ncbi:MAG: radical SAM protein, partial [Candidatus Tectomicrobia bacterium]|nr:radical SAM protein [Candidatus Tectomicrobia bacterium]